MVPQNFKYFNKLSLFLDTYMAWQVTLVQAEWRLKAWLLHDGSACGLTATEAFDRICCARDTQLQQLRAGTLKMYYPSTQMGNFSPPPMGLHHEIMFRHCNLETREKKVWNKTQLFLNETLTPKGYNFNASETPKENIEHNLYYHKSQLLNQIQLKVIVFILPFITQTSQRSFETVLHVCLAPFDSVYYVDVGSCICWTL